MADIAPGLKAAIERDYTRLVEDNTDVKKALEKLENGRADYVTAYRYANALSACLTTALNANISSDKLPDGRLYYNIADRAVRPFLELLEEQIAEYCDRVQVALNEKAGLGIKAV